ncbi:F-type H+-transporting ATPase subunit b [Desulfoprunum benzoelyticum]|uniref:ATP synthase subunit b n=1 Tax=Desulfoprunum benzoelyticum TaxID=1506996 RepID=A0A840UMT5_9BACT|nr:F-type H+-transporting ATPase subunit b [Desulfoprunum benzoelyticum]
MKHVARLMVLVTAALWFALSGGTVWAAEQTSHEASGAVQEVASGQGQDAATVEPGHGAAAEGGHGAVKDSLSAEKLKDLGWRVVNFIALMIILVKFGAKPIGAGLAGRQKKIKDEIEELEAKRAAAEKSYRDFESKLATVEKDIDKIVEKAVAQAELEKVKILERAEQAAADIKRQAELAVQKEIMDARRYLKDEVADKAAAMAESLIMKNLTPGDQVKIVEDYLAKVGAVQ